MADDQRTMTIRLPRALHQRLHAAAYQARKSMNDIVVVAIQRELQLDLGSDEEKLAAKRSQPKPVPVVGYSKEQQTKGRRS